ncbi:AmpG family muropeptide MFS transporter [Asticcacaulis solisilvae]|uniref:AmpG family muropeptide MFS transporter n=1 Tax=Asticcacaulis solisilvae TaxID=1217274 RepID=UPI003FD7B8FE
MIETQNLKSKINGVAAALKRPVSWLLLGLGFSASLPFLLVGQTLGFWMRSEGITLTLISYLTGISLMYGLKVLWAPWMDRVHLPLLYRWLGQRRSYMLLTQVVLAAGLAAMAVLGPKAHLIGFMIAATVVAFAAASQEIAIDAWRVEETNSRSDQALNPSFYSFGYRTGSLVTNSIVLALSDRIGWANSYLVIAATLGVGVVSTLLAPRTANELRHTNEARSAKDLIVEPFISFVRQHGRAAGIVLLLLALYRLPDYVIGPVVGTMYQDTGLSATTIAAIRGTIGLTASYIGVIVGGGCVLTLGLERALWLGAITCPLTKLGFAWMSVAHGDIGVFTGVLIADDLSNGIAETAMIAFMTSLAGRDHTLTHYALTYSVMAFTGKFLKLFAGQIVDGLTPGHGLFGAYQLFFVGSAAIGVPALLLIWLARKKGVFSANPAGSSPA